MDPNTQSLQDEDQSVQSTDQNEEVVEQDTQLDDQSQATEQAAEQTQQENQNEDDRILSRGERRREQYAEKMANRIRTQAEQDAAAGRSLFNTEDINYKPIAYEAGEFDVDELKRDRQEAERMSYNKGIQQGASLYELERFGDRLDTDIERVMSKHEMTDRRENLLIQSYLREVGAQEDSSGRLTIARPNVRFKDFAENYLKEIDDIVAEEVSQSTKNLQTQAANTGVRPNGQSASSLTNLSDQQLVEKLRASDIDTDEGKRLMEENRRRQKAALGY